MRERMLASAHLAVAQRKDVPGPLQVLGPRGRRCNCAHGGGALGRGDAGRDALLQGSHESVRMARLRRETRSGAECTIVWLAGHQPRAETRKMVKIKNKKMKVHVAAAQQQLFLGLEVGQKLNTTSGSQAASISSE